jgi:hypothetical protein
VAICNDTSIVHRVLGAYLFKTWKDEEKKRRPAANSHISIKFWRGGSCRNTLTETVQLQEYYYYRSMFSTAIEQAMDFIACPIRSVLRLNSRGTFRAPSWPICVALRTSSWTSHRRFSCSTRRLIVEAADVQRKQNVANAAFWGDYKETRIIISSDLLSSS